MIDDLLQLSAADISLRVSWLTPAERKTIVLTVKGKSDREVAYLLSITERTVRHHLQSARARVGAESRTQLIAMFAIWQYITSNNSLARGVMAEKI